MDKGLSLGNSGMACLQRVQYQYSLFWLMWRKSALEQQGQSIEAAVVKEQECYEEWQKKERGRTMKGGDLPSLNYPIKGTGEMDL